MAARTNSLTVSVLTSVLVPRDAISNACRQQVEALARYGRAQGLRMNIKLYAVTAAVPGSRIALISDPAGVALDPHFLESDIILYQFGICYPLFDSIHLAPPTAKVVVCYYGLTPPALVPEHQRAVLHESYRQAVNLHAADQILVTSRFLMEELDRMSIPAAKMVHMPLWSSFNQAPRLPRSKHFGTELRLVYVGRFVPAKGVHDLLQGFNACLGRSHLPLQLDLIGSRTFSDRAYLERLQSLVAEQRLGGHVRFHFDVPEAELVRSFGDADALIIPSYHEGFCMPVIEALTCGCFVICSDAGALPETSGGLGRTFPTGDADALCTRLEEFAAARERGGFATDSGFLTVQEWQARVAEHLAWYSAAAGEERFCCLVFDDLNKVDDEIRRCLAQVRRQTVLSLRERPLQSPENGAFQVRVAEALAVRAIRPAA
jgi:glycosyltransferase involved in cell wall biosynthesis